MLQKTNTACAKSNSTNPLVSYLLITHNRKQDLKDAIVSILNQSYTPIEIVIVDNNSTDGTPEMIRENFKGQSIRYIRLSENKGVCGGRNVAIEAAKGEILITIDDDAIIDDPNATVKVVNRLSRDPTIGVLAFKVLNYFTHELDKDFFPTRDKKRAPNEEFEIATFIGVGHAIPRYVYEQVGLYRDYFPYGHEEFDLALRILDTGYKILFFPEVVVYHKAGSRRQRLVGKWSILLENRVKVAIRNLPWKYVVTTTLIWSIRTFVACRGNVIPVLKAWHNLWKQRHKLKEERHLIKRETCLLYTSPSPRD